MSKPTTLTTTLPKCFMMYDTKRNEYICGAKGQYVFGDSGTMKRSYIHCSTARKVAEESALEAEGHGCLIEDLHQLCKDSSTLMQSMTYAEYQQTPLYRQFQSAQSAYNKLVWELQKKKKVKKIPFSKQSRVVVHKMINMQVEEIK